MTRLFTALAILVIASVLFSTSCNSTITSQSTSKAIASPESSTPLSTTTSIPSPTSAPLASTTPLTLQSSAIPSPSLPAKIPSPPIPGTRPASPPAVTPIESAKLTDTLDDIFDSNNKSVTTIPYLDLTGGEVTLWSDGHYSVKITINTDYPTSTEQASNFIEWDLMVDSDGNPSTGWNSSPMFNDIGTDYLIRIGLNGTRLSSSAIDTKTNQFTPLQSKVDKNSVEVSFFPINIGTFKRFNFVIVSRKYAAAGNANSLVAADKMPNQGHYSFPGAANVQAPGGLLSDSIQSNNATLYYNPGNADSAQWYADAFEMAVAASGKQFGSNLKKKFTLYVYNNQNDLVAGLQKYSGFTSSSVSMFKVNGSPRPMNYVMHIPPSFSWHDIVHEYTHTVIEEFSQNAYLNAKWLDEGLAEYFGYQVVCGTKYQPLEVRWSESRINLVKTALTQGKLPGLASISTEDQIRSGDVDLIYAEGYASVSYIADKYGVGKCMDILKQINGGNNQESAILKVLGLPLSQLETDFRASLK